MVKKLFLRNFFVVVVLKRFWDSKCHKLLDIFRTVLLLSQMQLLCFICSTMLEFNF